MTPFGRLLLRLKFGTLHVTSGGVEAFCIDLANRDILRFWNLELGAELSVLLPHAATQNEQGHPCFRIEIHNDLGRGVPEPRDSYGYVPFVQFQALLLCWRYRLIHPPSQGLATFIRMPPGRVSGPEPIVVNIFNISGQWWIRSLQVRDIIDNLLPPPYDRD